MSFKGPDWHTQHTPMWRKMLEPLIDKEVRCLEIGSYEGRSARWLLKYLSKAHLTCIDPFTRGVDGSGAPDIGDRESTFDKMVANEFGARIFKWKGTSLDWLPYILASHDPPNFKNTLIPFDFIYVDGSHLGPDVLFDAVNSFELLAPGGLLCFDDFGLYGGAKDMDPTLAPKSAISYFIAVNQKRLEVLHAEVQCWIRKL